MTLDLYGHLWPDRLDEVADRLEEGRQLLRTALLEGFPASSTHPARNKQKPQVTASES